MKKPFTLLKFRTMRVNTISVATHLSNSSSITRFGHFLRRTKLDELPQLWNVLKGEMSLVGPRPGLFNQEELTEARERYGVFTVRPGITGLSQVNEIDMSTPELLAVSDAKMISEMSISNYFKYIFQTFVGKVQVIESEARVSKKCLTRFFTSLLSTLEQLYYMYTHFGKVSSNGAPIFKGFLLIRHGISNHCSCLFPHF